MVSAVFNAICFLRQLENGIRVRNHAHFSLLYLRFSRFEAVTQVGLSKSGNWDRVCILIGLGYGLWGRGRQLGYLQKGREKCGLDTWRGWTIMQMLLEEGSGQHKPASSTGWVPDWKTRPSQEDTLQHLFEKTSQLGQMSFTGMGGGRKGGCPRVRDDAEGRKHGQEDGNTRPEQRFMLL